MFSTPEQKKNNGHRVIESISTSRSFKPSNSFDKINTSIISSRTLSRGTKTETKQVRICDVLEFLVVDATNDKFLFQEELPDSVLIEKYNSDPLVQKRINLKLNKLSIYKNKNGGKRIEDEENIEEDDEDTITFSNFKQKEQAHEMKLYERYYKLFAHKV